MEENNNVNTGLPVTPVSPVLPADQNMETQELAPAAPIETNINPEAQAIPNSPVMQTTPEISVAIEPQVEVAPAPVPNIIGADVAPTPAPEVAPAVMPSAPVAPAAPSAVVDPMADPMAGSYISPVGEYVDGGKIGNTTPRADSVAAKKSKNSKLVLIIVLLVILVAGGVGGFYYYSQYKTSTKRISAVFNGIRALTNGITNDSIEKVSGTYDLDISLSSQDVNASAKVKGSFKRDLDAKKLDFTMDLEKLNMGEDLINAPINVELYYGDSNFYFLLQNFYSEYIYEEVPEFDQYFNSIQQNDINYQLIITGFESALESAVNAMAKTTSVEKVNINGKSIKSNVIGIGMNEFNQTNGVNAFYSYFLNNEAVMSEIAKLNGTKLEEVKKSFEDALASEKNYEDINGTLYIYTSMFKNELYGIRYALTEDNKTTYYEICPENGGYKLSVREDDQNIFDIAYTVVEERHLETVDTSYSFTGVFYNDNKANKFTVDLKMVKDVTPKDIKINVKNSVKLEYLTPEAKAEILEKAKNTGQIGLYLPSLLSQLLGVSETPQVNQDDASVTNGEENTNTCGLEGAC